MVMQRFLSCAKVLLAFSPLTPLLLFALNLPRRLAATADALSGMVHRFASSSSLSSTGPGAALPTNDPLWDGR
jgi:hypothetical protein